jgi:hypothetical protein
MAVKVSEKVSLFPLARREASGKYSTLDRQVQRTGSLLTSAGLSATIENVALQRARWLNVGSEIGVKAPTDEIRLNAIQE